MTPFRNPRRSLGIDTSTGPPEGVTLQETRQRLRFEDTKLADPIALHAGRLVFSLPAVAALGAQSYTINADWVRVTMDYPAVIRLDGRPISEIEPRISRRTIPGAGPYEGQHLDWQSGTHGPPFAKLPALFFEVERQVKVIEVDTLPRGLGSDFNTGDFPGLVHVWYGRGGVTNAGLGRPVHGVARIAFPGPQASSVIIGRIDDQILIPPGDSFSASSPLSFNGVSYQPVEVEITQIQIAPSPSPASASLTLFDLMYRTGDSRFHRLFSASLQSFIPITLDFPAIRVPLWALHQRFFSPAPKDNGLWVRLYTGGVTTTNAWSVLASWRGLN